MAEHLWSSSRLIYRGVEASDDELILEMESDAEGYLSVSPYVPSPPNKQLATNVRTQMLEKALLAAVICLPAKNSDGTKADPTPIGHIFLSSVDPRRAHHRCCNMGINVLPKYREKGYGTEAIHWVLRWGFQRANLHSIGLGAFSFNERALHVYERVGFKVEGRRREQIWHDGKYHDHVVFGMLEHEWRVKNLKS